MKRWKVIQSIVDTICHDPFGYNPKWKWKALPVNARNEYQRILPILKAWESNGYISLLEDEEYAFIVYPEKLPNKEHLMQISRRVKIQA